MNTKSCFAPAHILLPSEQIPLEKWGCIACDQFTSDRDYWQKAEAAAAGSPSTLNMILPEVYLEDGDADARIEKIHATMDDYARNVLTRAVDGFVYVERTEQSGKVRQGLVGMVDLEAYSYRRGEKCTVRPSEVFQRDGYDVWVTVPITYSQAVLGDSVTVPSIDGKVEYTVPEGTQSGTTFRLRGKGIQYLNGRGRGDMYVKCEVEIPKKLNKAQRDALKKFEGTLKEENYEKRKGFFKKLKDMFNA